MASLRRRTGRTARAPRRGRAAGLGVRLTVLALLPLWPLLAYPLERSPWVRAGWRRSGQPPGPMSRYLRGVSSNIVVLALGSPMRFLVPLLAGSRLGRALHLPGPERGTPTAGVREPRRPRPGPPSDLIALTEPRG